MSFPFGCPPKGKTFASIGTPSVETKTSVGSGVRTIPLSSARKSGLQHGIVLVLSRWDRHNHGWMFREFAWIWIVDAHVAGVRRSVCDERCDLERSRFILIVPSVSGSRSVVNLVARIGSSSRCVHRYELRSAFSVLSSTWILWGKHESCRKKNFFSGREK